jgi:GNAT superfamily N-acetyltransferase
MDESGTRASTVDGHLAVIRVTEEDWRDLKQIRLAALGEAPGAFGSTLCRERDLDEDHWRAWARSAGMFIARAGSPVGMAAGVPGRIDAERKLVAMWVDPGWRGRGVAAELMSAVIGWAGAEGAERVMLWVAQGNDSARRFYGRRGFEFTGNSKPLPSNPVLGIDEMVLDLSSPPAG